MPARRYKWTDLTEPQQRVLRECSRRGIYQAGRQFNTCHNLRDMGLLRKTPSHNEYELTYEGRRLADVGRDYKPSETKQQRIERLYNEAMNSTATRIKP